MSDEMVIFTRTYDLVTWLLERAEKFPRAHRFVVTRRLQDAVLDFQERLVEANRFGPGAERRQRLRLADAELGKVRLYLRLVHRWRWLSDGQYEHAAERVAEVGRLLGGWLKSTKPRGGGEESGAPRDRA